MFSLILPASRVPEGYEVFKVTGNKPYTFRKTIKIYGEDRQEIIPGPGLCFLVSEGNVNCISDSTKLRLDFNSIVQLKGFIDINLHSHQ